MMPGKAMLPIIVTVILAVFSFIAWVVLLGGLASFHYRLSTTVKEPGELLSYEWWVTWFTLPLIIASVAAAALKHPSVIVRPLALLFAVAFTKLTIAADITYHQIKVGTEWTSQADNRLGAILAGAIMLSIGTLGMAVWLAMLDAVPMARASGKAAAAPGHAAPAAQPPAGGYVANMPHQAHPAAGAYNYGTPGAANYSTPDGVVLPPNPGQPGVPQGIAAGPQGMVAVPSPGAPSPGAPALMQPGVVPVMPVQGPAVPLEGYQAPGAPGVVAPAPSRAASEAPGDAPGVSTSHDGTPAGYAQPPAGQA